MATPLPGKRKGGRYIRVSDLARMRMEAENGGPAVSDDGSAKPVEPDEGAGNGASVSTGGESQEPAKADAGGTAADGDGAKAGGVTDGGLLEPDGADEDSNGAEAPRTESDAVLTEPTPSDGASESINGVESESEMKGESSDGDEKPSEAAEGAKTDSGPSDTGAGDKDAQKPSEAVSDMSPDNAGAKDSEGEASSAPEPEPAPDPAPVKRAKTAARARKRPQRKAPSGGRVQAERPANPRQLQNVPEEVIIMAKDLCSGLTASGGRPVGALTNAEAVSAVVAFVAGRTDGLTERARTACLALADRRSGDNAIDAFRQQLMKLTGTITRLNRRVDGAALISTMTFLDRMGLRTSGLGADNPQTLGDIDLTDPAVVELLRRAESAMRAADHQSMEAGAPNRKRG